MLEYFGAVGSIARFSEKFEKQTLKRVLVYLMRIVLVVAVFRRTLNDSIWAVDKLVLIDLIIVEFEFAFGVRALYLGFLIHLSGQ